MEKAASSHRLTDHPTVSTASVYPTADTLEGIGQNHFGGRVEKTGERTSYKGSVPPSAGSLRISLFLN